MTHLAEGTLQAYLDDEVTGRDRAAAAEHLLVCGECRAALDALRETHQRLSEALAELDVAIPSGAPGRELRRRVRGFRGGSLVRAAILVLLVAAAASASVPGSPVREWIAQAVAPSEDAGVPETGAVEAVPEAPAVEQPFAPAGIAIPGLRDADIVVNGLRDATIRLVRTEGAGIAVSAVGGERDPLFRMGRGRIEVVGGSGGVLLVEVPRERASFRLVVDGERYAESAGGALRVLRPGETDGDAVVWR